MLIPVRKVILFLLLLEIILVAMYFFPLNWSVKIAEKFNLDNEANIPTWFSTVLLFSVSLTSSSIYFLGRNLPISPPLNSFWLGFGAVLCFLSLDEASMIHEGLGHFFNVPWFYIYAPPGAIFFMVTTYFLIAINKNKALTYWILGGLVLYAFGGLCGETIYYYFYSGHFEVVFEEGFEILGEIIILAGCLHELNRRLRIFHEHCIKI